MYLQESDYNVRAKNDPLTFFEAMSCKEFELWFNPVKDEISSMAVFATSLTTMRDVEWANSHKMNN